MGNKTRELAKNTLIIAVGGLSVQLVSFLLLPLYTTYLKTGDYGVVDLITTYTALLAPAVVLQLDMAAFRFLIDVRKDEQSKVSIISTVVQMTSLLLVTFVVLFTLVAKFVHVVYAPLILLSISTAVIAGVFMQCARGLGRNKVFAASGVVAGCVAILLNVILIAQFHMGARGMLIGSIAGNASSAICAFLALHLYKYIDLRHVDKHLRQDLLRYALPLVPNMISWWIINASDRTIISIFLGLSANGIYAIAYKFPTIFSTIFSFFSMSWNESAALHINSNERNKFFSDIANTSVRFFGSMALIIVSYLSVVFGLFISNQYKEAYLYIPILIAASFFNSLVGFYSAIYIAKKLTKQVAVTSIFSALINVSLSLALVRLMGLYATALATAMAYLVMAVYRHHDAKKYVTITYDGRLFIGVTALSIMVATFYYYDNPLLNIISAFISSGAALYLNRSMIIALKKSVLARLKGLSSEQEVTASTLSV